MADFIDSSSKKISELERLSSLNDDDLFVFERADESSSYKLSYGQLKEDIFTDISAKLDLGTIAAHEVDDFAKFAHGHPYTDFWYYPSYGPDSMQPQPDESYKVGEFEVVKYLPGEHQSESSSIDVNVPLGSPNFDNQLSTFKQHDIGDLVLFQSGKMAFNDYLSTVLGYTLVEHDGKVNIDTAASSFNGFVLPNGDTLTCGADEFLSACQTFAGNKNATSFTLPNMSHFFKLNPGTRSIDPNRLVEHYTALSVHDHGGQFSGDGDQNQIIMKNIEFSIRTSSTGKYTKHYMHGGKGKVMPNAHPVLSIDLIKVNASISDIEIADNIPDLESYPEYDDIGALVYIGNR